MTTTADRIEQLRRDFERLRIKIEELERMQAEEPEPKPLECWGYVSTDIFQGYMRREEAERMDISPVHMREVTPQDEQDRKDGARYRKAKEAAERNFYLWTRMLQLSVDQWDEIIDEAMEE